MAETLSVSELLPNKFEAKKKYLFLLAIEGVDAFIVKTAARPSYTTEEIVIPFVNSTRYLAGKTTFGEMAVTLHDPIAPSGAQQIMEWIRLHFENVSGRAGYADFYKRDLQLKLLDPIGTLIELWDIKGAWIKSADFGGLDYGAGGEPTEISLSLRYDAAVLQF